jgi:hypothetical protein
MSDQWNEWWRRRGEERLALLLWAVWNPIGPVPLDEYDSYTGQVASILRKAHDADVGVISGDGEISDAVQLQRNRLAEAATVELANLLAELRDERMGIAAAPETDRQAAQTLLEWYEWEMDELER